MLTCYAGPNAIKLFKAIINTFLKKAEVFVLGKPFQPNQIVLIKEKKMGKPTREIHSNLLRKNVYNERKKFHSIAP
jgi:hypothetical protein